MREGTDDEKKKLYIINSRITRTGYCSRLQLGYRQSGACHFSAKENEDYVSIIWNDREYVPYCAISPTERGEYLGYMEDDPDVEIYELDGYSSEEWIIDYLNLKSCGEAMLYKEVNVRDIPDGFSSEYEWNHMEDEACAWLPTALYFQ